MICVIADDLTGAAELGAIGLRYGLRAEVVMLGPSFAQKKPAPRTGNAFLLELESVDLICLDTDSRACRPTEAARRAAAAARLASRMKPVLIYKKTDSVLRGPVAAEINAILDALGKTRALLVPANPSRGRIIKGGKYYVNGKPIHLTEFAAHPLHPRKTSDVRELVEPNGLLPVQARRPNEPLPRTGILIGEVGTTRQLAAWANMLDEQTLAAGGADFFNAILRTRRDRPRRKTTAQPPAAEGSQLFVCGTYSDSARRFIAKARQAGVPVLPLLNGKTPRLRLSGETLDAVAVKAAKCLREHRQLILCTGEPLIRGRAAAKRLLAHLTAVAAQVLERAGIQRIYIEGGATAAALLDRLGWHQLSGVSELAPGVVSLRPRNAAHCLVTIKPGSYSWPDEILD